MYNVERYLPFLEKATVIKQYTKSIMTKQIFVLPKWGVVDTSKRPVPIRNFTGLLVKPLNLVVMTEATIPEIVLLVRNRDYVTMSIKEVDYQEVAEILDLDVEKNEAMYPSILYGAYEKQEVDTFELVNQAILGKELQQLESVEAMKTAESERHVSSSGDVANRPVYEELSLDSFSGGSSKVEDEEETAMVTRLRSYFDGGYTTNRVPLLVGQSAVGKSALIKSLTDEYGYRLIDVRTAFMSRLDIEGLTQKVDLGDSLQSFNCPMSDFVEATDAYIEYCERAAQIVRDAIATEKDPEKIANLQYALGQFEYGAKTPVLLFDEVTRGEGSVRQALTKILTDKEFSGYSMKRARVIAATNAVVDDDGLPEDLFLTKDIDDVAFFDRFESIPVSVSDAYPGWVKWAKSKSKKYSGTNIHPAIVDYATQRDHCYDVSPMVSVYDRTGDMNETTTTVYPNFRTWERVSDYLYSLDGKNVSKDMIAALIGPNEAEKVMQWLEASGYREVKEKKDMLTDAVDNGIASNIPTLLISPSSMGKTSRIKKAVEDKGYTFIQVNLGQQDRLDLSGPPVKVDINRFILDKKVSVPEEVKEALMEELNSSALPKLVTMRAPKSDLVKKFADAQATGRKVVLFYDELNRVQNPSVMSSVFEAISDHKAFGINFNPDNVTIFAACNLGDNMGDASQLDPAIANRFAVYWKKAYDKDDVDSFIDYAKSSGMSKELISWLESMTPDDVIRVISSIDKRTIELSAASTRGIEDLDKFIKDTKHNAIMSGTVIFGDADSLSKVQNWINQKSVDALVEVMDTIENYISNWSAIRGKETYKVGNQTCTAKDLADLFEDVYSKYRNDTSGLNMNRANIENLVASIVKIDTSIKTKREKCAGLFLGYNAGSFTNYYNQISGREVDEVKVEDIIDLKMVPKYVAQVFRGFTRLAELDKAGVKCVEEVYEYYKDALPWQNCRKLIDEILSKLPSADAVLNFLRGVAVDVGGKDTIFEVAENGDEGYAQSVLIRAGIKTVVKGAGTKPVVLR